MNRTIKDATVKRFHYESHDQLRTHLADFMAAYNFARRLKTLSGLTPYEYICKIWTSEPDRFNVDPIHQMPGLNTYGVKIARRFTERRVSAQINHRKNGGITDSVCAIITLSILSIGTVVAAISHSVKFLAIDRIEYEAINTLTGSLEDI